MSDPLRFEYHIFVVEDTHGKKCGAVCEETGDTIQMCGLKNSAGVDEYFESDAYHLGDWALARGFKYKHIDKAEVI